MKKLPDNSIDLTVTSPPYDDLRDYNGYEFNFEIIANLLYKVTKQGGIVVWIVGDSTINGSETGTSFKQALYFKDIGFNLHDTMIWEKSTLPQNSNRYEPNFEYMFICSKGTPRVFNPIMTLKKYKDNRNIKNGHRDRDGNFTTLKVSKSPYKIKGNIWNISTGGGIVTKDKIAYNHPAIFPEKLVNDHILSWSNEGDIVLDPLCGSGTTCKIAAKLKRDFIGIEISKNYCEIAKKRINNELAQYQLF